MQKAIVTMEVPQKQQVLENVDIGAEKDVLEVLKQAIGDETVIFEADTAENPEEGEIEEIIEIIEEVEEEDETSPDYDGCFQNTKRIKTEQHRRNTESSEETQDSVEQEGYCVERESPIFKVVRANEGGGGKHAREESVQTKRKQVITYDADEDWQEDEEMEQAEEMEGDVDDSSELSNQRTESLEPQATLSGEKKSKSSSSARTAQSDAHYVKMEQLSENTIPIEGTIYYEGDNMETLYVAQSVDEHEEDYQYDTASMEQEEQTWEGTNSDTVQNQEEENSQDQIFLHEDEDGQLYFKDDNGSLQPVYLTEDGNYAIAENSDDQDSKESHGKSQQIGRTSESSSFVLSDTESKVTHTPNKQNVVVPASTINDLDNEDNTVTISLIISEDEHGQKRTQVIIPTTDNLKCDICNKSFKTSFQLLRHNRLKHAREEDITTRNFPCDLCPKRYPDQNSLARHRKTHTGDRPFQCLECHKNFPTSTALRRHLTLHNSQSRPLPCIYCGRRFIEKESLTKHEQSHLAGDQRTHTCDICHKSFADATDLSLHKKYHDTDKKFDCEVCGREFNRLNNLQRHMMVHQQQGANEEILSCDVCGITYKFMSSLTRHMVTTHMNPEKLRQQAEEQRRKRENNYRRYLENRKMYETQQSGAYGTKRNYHQTA